MKKSGEMESETLEYCNLTLGTLVKKTTLRLLSLLMSSSSLFTVLNVS